MKKRYLPLFPALFLVGCTPYTTEFKCPIGQGMSCRSMSEVHDAVQSGELSQNVERSSRAPQFYFPPQNRQEFGERS